MWRFACLSSVSKEELACGGCKSDTAFAGCRACPLRECAIQKGVAHCIDCAEYPCRLFNQWKMAGKLLPHINEISVNIAAIKRTGIETWFALQKARWSCPDCGTLFSWYARTCSECGRKLKKNAYRLKGLRRILYRWMFPKIYRKAKLNRS